ncbi:MAG TPA: YgiT-type zinc finger protein [Candidatus Altiarchaeales archaeon]|nr:YgiT-type zinc finger protein [Candidatus Altiarchaeales archaeon]
MFHIILIDNVSTWICIQCGEVYFEEEKVNTI